MTDPFSTYAADVKRAAGQAVDLDIPKDLREFLGKAAERNRLLNLFETSRQVNLTQIREAVIFLLKGDLA